MFEQPGLVKNVQGPDVNGSRASGCAEANDLVPSGAASE